MTAPDAGLTILIPCKPLVAGKSRLAGILAPHARYALCAAFLRRSLNLARSLVPAGDVAVVTSCADAASIARAAGAAVLADTGRGLNEALSAARATLLETCAPPARLLILPIDLPLATDAALAPVLASRADVVLAPDRAGAGTNLLCLGAPALTAFDFAYGPGSRAAHDGQAAARGWRTDILNDARLAFDIDGPSDYARWLGGPAGQPPPRAEVAAAG